MKSLLALALALLAALPAGAADAVATERGRIQAERAAVEARFGKEQKACRALFAVTDCVLKAQTERNTALADLRRQERVLNDAERKRRAAERQKELDERSSPEKRAQEEERRKQAIGEQKAREATAADKAQKKAEEDAKRSSRPPRQARAPSGAPGPQGSPRTAHDSKAQGPTPDEAAKNRAAHAARIRAAEEHNAQLRQRIANRKKPAASDLPLPN